MLAATLSFPCYAKPRRLTIRNSVTNFSKCNSLKLRASLSDYPLASRIMVRNLPYSTSESSLRQEFSNFGEIAEVKLEKNGARKWSKGYAFIQYTCQEDAMLALENMDYKNFDGRVIYVELAKPGGNAFGGRPRTSGPPKVQHLQEQDEVPDCWY
ncbi:glycine-rich RNA-binding protein 4, mitochondrial [Corylus avellana]|uniref:glycine-rich RNA-binding protein 4, mitochondrial n=1 Tax=Corylus avellana TaxID=13451 RepID=UPI00286A89E4|nr:glycine-rich RNA-binding protein 4, mitochondrial [Corylus avellana]